MEKQFTEFVEGTLLWVELGSKELNGELTSGKRPCIILRVIDRYKCVIVPITTQKLDRVRTFELGLLVGEGGLKRESKILVDQFRNFPLSKFSCDDLIGVLTEERLTQVRMLFVGLLL